MLQRIMTEDTYNNGTIRAFSQTMALYSKTWELGIRWKTDFGQYDGASATSEMKKA